MAFIHEDISAADREWFNSFGLTNPVTRRSLHALEWTIDRERSAFLVALGGQGGYTSDIPMYYALVWKDHVVNLETFSTSSGNLSTGIEMFWKIPKIEAPGELLGNQAELSEVIREAFDAEGFAGRRDCVTKVNFEYMATPVFLTREV